MNYLFPMILCPSRITHKSFSVIDNIFINNLLATESGLNINEHKKKVKNELLKNN